MVWEMPMLHWEGCEVTVLEGTSVCIGWLRSMLQEIQCVTERTMMSKFSPSHSLKSKQYNTYNTCLIKELKCIFDLSRRYSFLYLVPDSSTSDSEVRAKVCAPPFHSNAKFISSLLPAVANSVLLCGMVEN